MTRTKRSIPAAIPVLCLVLALFAAAHAEGATQALPSVSVSKVSFGNILFVTVANNTDAVIDDISLRAFTYNANGDIQGNSTVLDYDHFGMGGLWKFTDGIRPGGTTTYEVDISFMLDDSITSASACVSAYHTTDGFFYEVAPEQMCIVHSDGTIDYPADASEPAALSNTEAERASGMPFGVSLLRVYPWLSSYYSTHAGDLITSVGEGSVFEAAGMKVGDIVLALDGVDSLGWNTWERAKLKMLDGEKVDLRFWRDGQAFSTLIARDMSTVSGVPEPVKTETAVEVEAPAQESWICPDCGAANRGKFCGDCGAAKPEESAEWTCPGCGQVNEGNFCANCGSARP